MRKIQWLAAASVIALSAGAAQAEEQPPLDTLVQRHVRDLSVAVVIESKDRDELGRMGKDFTDLYRFGKARLQFQEPGRMRVESRAGFLKVLYVVNQSRKLLSVPGIGVRSVQDVSGSSGSRQGLLEVGLVAPSLLELVTIRPVGSVSVGEGRGWLYELSYRSDPRKRQEIAVDPRTRTVVERRIYQPDGSLKARLRYRDPVQVADGVWVPQRVEVYSPRGRRAATTRYERIQANAGVDPEAFTF